MISFLNFAMTEKKKNSEYYWSILNRAQKLYQGNHVHCVRNCNSNLRNLLHLLVSICSHILQNKIKPVNFLMQTLNIKDNKNADETGP